MKGENKAMSALLVLRNLRLCLVHDWEATIATFPYLHLDGRSQVIVRGINIKIQIALTREGVMFRRVEAEPPDLDIQLSCSSVLSQVVLSTVLKVFQTFLQEIIQHQVQQLLLQLLQAEAAKWNESTWKMIMSVMPASLIKEGISWFITHIPPEGLPI